MRAPGKESVEDWALELNHFYDTAPFGLCFLDRELRYVRVNEKLAQINGKSIADHIGRRFQDVIPEIAARLEPILRQMLEDGKPVLDLEVCGPSASPEDPKGHRDWLCSYYPLTGDSGRVRGISAVVRDVTERRRAADALKESEARFQQLVERTNVIPWEADAATWETLYVGPQTTSILGYPVERWFERDFWVEHLHPEDREWILAHVKRMQETNDTYTDEYRMISADGGVVWIQDHVSVERHQGKPHVLRGFMLDITERKRAEEALRESEAALRLGHEKIQFLAGELLKTQETERRHVALELHEDVNQKLAALSISLSLLEREISAPADSLRKRVGALQERTAALIDDVRHLSRELHPAGIEHVGVAAALQTLCQEFGKKEGKSTQVDTTSSPDQVPFDVAMCLYRVTEESLRNIQRHSGASSVQVRLAATDEGMRLSISDDGVGFDISQVQPARGVGLLSMEERVRLLKGSLRIESRPGGGTELEVLVPVAERN